MKTSTDFKGKYLRQLPAVGKLMEHPKLLRMLEMCPRILLVKAIHDVLDAFKTSILTASSEEQINNLDLSFEGIVNEVFILATKNSRMSLRRAINATGDVLSHSLGRAPLNESAQKALQGVAGRYSTLAVDIETGDHCDRDIHIQDLLSILTGAEAGLVLNNNASAIMLILNTVCNGKEVIVSRGQLIENDGFRLPDVIAKSGAKMMPIGTTNKTHLHDYHNAINENTGAILKVHKSSYRIVGFTEEVPIQELADLGRRFNIPIIDNIGNCCLDLTQQGFPEEPSASLSIKSGADIVCFSGDKLLSGPQAGIVIGSRKYISMMKENSLYRILRASKLTIVALEASLRSYLDSDRILETNPVLRFLSRSLEEITLMTQSLAGSLNKKLSELAIVTIEDSYSRMESFLSMSFPTRLISIKPVRISAKELGKRLRLLDLPVFVIVHEDCILIDLRSVWDDELDEIATALEKCCRS